MREEEFNSMLCDECNSREATYTIAMQIGGEMVTRHLCSECVAKMNASIATGHIKDLLSSILSAITGSHEEEETKENEEVKDEIICERCGMTLGKFTKGGRLGCPACYETFREQLQPMLLQIHGRVQHAGRRPLPTADEQQLRSRREQLTQLLAQAISTEDFESAAQIRDQLRAMATAKEAE